MTIEEADKIVQIWGKYLEHCFGRLNQLFTHNGGKIPESLLPYSKSILSEALNTMAKHYHDVGNKRMVKLMEGTKASLEFYGNDEEAIQRAGKNFNDIKQRELIVSAIKDWQKTWLTTQQ